MTVGHVLHWFQRRLLLLLLATYALGIALPGPGLTLRSIKLGRVPWPSGAIHLSLPMVLLGFLLMVAGLGTRLDELRDVARRPGVWLAGLVVNSLYPVAFAVAVSVLLLPWHNPDEVQNVLVGLALIGSMPIAGSSTAWAQNGGGNLALSLGLVLGSTALSPVLTPLGLHAVGLVTHGDYSEDLHELASQGAGAFVVWAVVVPSALGLALRGVLGARRLAPRLPMLKIGNLLSLLVLNYSNAAVSLPQLKQQTDWDFIGLILLVTSVMCVGAFAAGLLLGRLFGADHADRTSLAFGLGMNNNGTGLVLAAASLADHPRTLLPIVFYNLVQQVAAGLVDRRIRLRQRRQDVTKE